MEEFSSWGPRECNVPSTGKSSNSSSSSNAAAGFCWSLRVEASVESETVAFVVGPEPSAAADIVAGNYYGLGKEEVDANDWVPEVGTGSCVTMMGKESSGERKACPKAEAWRATSMTQAKPH